MLDKAQHGVDKYSEEEELEQIKLAVASAMLKGNGFLDTENLNAELQDRFQKGAEQIGNSKRWSLKLDKNYTIYENGNVEENESLLPAEYQQVEYLESSGTQYIDTGIKPNNKTKLSIYVEPTNIPETSSWFGARNANSATEGIAFLLWQVGDSFRFDYNNQKQTSVRIENNKKISVLWDRNNIYIDNNLVSTFNETEFECPVTLILCSSKNNRVDGISVNEDNVDTRMSKLKIYNCSIWNNDVLVRKYIPCYKNSDKKLGLYDTVEGKFYTNKGTGAFGYGMEDGTYVAPTNN